MARHRHNTKVVLHFTGLCSLYYAYDDSILESLIASSPRQTRYGYLDKEPKAMLLGLAWNSIYGPLHMLSPVKLLVELA